MVFIDNASGKLINYSNQTLHFKRRQMWKELHPICHLSLKIIIYTFDHIVQRYDYCPPIMDLLCYFIHTFGCYSPLSVCKDVRMMNMCHPFLRSWQKGLMRTKRHHISPVWSIWCGVMDVLSLVIVSVFSVCSCCTFHLSESLWDDTHSLYWHLPHSTHC